MAQSIAQLADELDMLNLNDRNGKKGSGEEVKAHDLAEQELSYDVSKDKLMNVLVKRTITPDRVIIQFKDDMLNTNSPAKADLLAEIFEEFNCKNELVAAGVDAAEDLDSRRKAVHELYLNHKYAIFQTWTWCPLYDYEDSDSESYSDYDSPLIRVDNYSIGIIVSFLPADTEYTVFMCDLGCISTCTELDMCPIPPGKEFLSENLLYALVTIPGIVPREGMDSILAAGLETVNFQDSDWDKGAVEDVRKWLPQYKCIMLRKLQLVHDSPSFFYGDLYGSNDNETGKVHKEDLLTVYMTRQAHVFFNSELASRVYAAMEKLDITF